MTAVIDNRRREHAVDALRSSEAPARSPTHAGRCAAFDAPGAAPHLRVGRPGVPDVR